MTTFTRIRINPRHRAARHALASNERIHAIVQRATAAGSPDGDQQRTLWRLDPGHTVHALYIVSSGYVNAAVIQEQLGAELSDIATCSYDPFLAQLATGQQWRFRLKANPTKNIGSRQPGIRGKRIPITKQDEQIEWLT
ncbi:type I-E CRISPR-associated protein Cas6/Cse3/CasE, partial [uncultured Bifidobacterium sp.]